ncbi:MAG: CDP-glycerol glycerophosphotransferase family protein [Chloroflexi bacterium]|nr:CDP-glycerol glycerophosphotransferase family protein [Chloroflexota bacterium]
MTRLEYLVVAPILRMLRWLFGLLPVRPGRVTLATARLSYLDGNLLFIHRAIARLRPGTDVRLVLEPYSYGFFGKVRYALGLVRGTYLLATSRLVVVDNAWLPVHVARHRAATEVVQVWHAEGALKRFGVDAVTPLAEPERTFLHRHYDWVVTSGEASRAAWSKAFRTPVERVLPLGTPRTDLFFDADAKAAAKARLVSAYPALAGRRVILYAPTFRGRGREKRPSAGLEATELRAALAPLDVLVLKGHPNLDPTLASTAGFDLVVDPSEELNALLLTTDILITDYSSAIFDAALLRLPMVLLVGDLAEYERDPGLYVDYASDMVGTQVRDTAGVIEAITTGRFDLEPYPAFVQRHLGPSDGRASDRFVERFVPPIAAPLGR